MKSGSVTSPVIDQIVLLRILYKQFLDKFLRQLRDDVKSLVFKIPFSGRNVLYRFVVIVSHEGR